MQLVMADATEVYDNRVDGTRRKRRTEDLETQTRSLYVASDSEHDAQSRWANPCVRSNPTDSRVDRPANPYERRLRRKTREDRYEPKGNVENEKTSLPAKTIRKKKLLGRRKGNPRIGERFCAENVRPGRLTFNFNENLGIFKKGKTSVPVHCSDVPYLNFSETKFLSKEPQTLPNSKESTEEIQEQSRPGEDEAVASRFKKPSRRPQEPKGTTLSNIHNSECPSTCRPNMSQNSPRKGPSQAIGNRDPSRERPNAGDRCFVGLNTDPSLLGIRTSRNMEYSGASIEEKLFDSLRNCDQLKIPYEEYKPTFLNGFLYTLEDLKYLYAMRAHLQLGTDVDYIENTTKANFERSIEAEDTLGNYDMLSLVPELMNVTEETLLEFLLDTENQVSKHATFKFLERAVNHGELGEGNTGAYSELNTDFNKSGFESDLEKLLHLTTDLVYPNQFGELSGEISHLEADTLSDTEATKQVTAIESSLPDGSSLPGGTFPRNIDEHLLPMFVRDQPHDKSIPFWAIDVPPWLISQNAHPYQSGLGDVLERRFWRRHKLY